jgi:arylsulfatase A-like enzyme
MDALAERGTLFDRAYSAAAWTIPSTASVLTGASAPEHGLGFGGSYYLSDSLVTVAEAFQTAGFTTGGFACNPLIARSRNFAQGFEYFRDYSWPRGEEIRADVDQFLEQHTGERFFLYVHYVDPHYPYEPTAAAAEGIVGEPPPDPREAVAATLDDFHDAASRADGKRYFAHFAKGAVFLGTDATERWTIDQFRAYAEPFFSAGQGWTYVPTERHVRVRSNGRVAWFDERLDNANLGETRGSGALVKESGEWKVAQYNLTIPVPNELARELAEKIRALPGS